MCSFGGGTVDERTADSKSFQMSDHSVKKIIYSENISYEKEGSFILINNGLYGDADSSVGTDGSTANGYRNVGTRLTKKSGKDTTEYVLNGNTILAEVKSNGERMW